MQSEPLLAEGMVIDSAIVTGSSISSSPQKLSKYIRRSCAFFIPAGSFMPCSSIRRRSVAIDQLAGRSVPPASSPGLCSRLLAKLLPLQRVLKVELAWENVALSNDDESLDDPEYH